MAPKLLIPASRLELARRDIKQLHPPEGVEQSRSPFLVFMESHWDAIYPAWLKGRGWIKVTRMMFPAQKRPGIRTLRRLMITALELKGLPTTRPKRVAKAASAGAHAKGSKPAAIPRSTAKTPRNGVKPRARSNAAPAAKKTRRKA